MRQSPATRLLVALASMLLPLGLTSSSTHPSTGSPARTLRVRVRSAGLGWGTAESRPTRPVGHRIGVRRVVTYHLETRGEVADLATFARLAQETFEDPRGWRGSGVEFRRVARGGQFSLVLAEPSWLPRFSPICSTTWSCRVGRHVVINHETGHWLGPRAPRMPWPREAGSGDDAAVEGHRRVPVQPLAHGVGAVTPTGSQP